jgi:hypothetical protein
MRSWTSTVSSRKELNNVEYVNKNPHFAAVENNDGKLQRIQPGEVVEADGGFADRLSRCPGVESASSADKKAWDGRNDTAAVASAGPTPQSAVQDALAEARGHIAAATAALNQIVIGDDQAPYGPPSGVVTTVQAVKDPEHFGPLSAAHVGPVPDADTAAGKIGGLEQATGAEVHNSQVEAHNLVGDVASELAALQGGGEPQSDSDGDEYEDLKGDELDAELESRGLPKSGTVAEKRDRLREDDSANADDSDDDS